MILVVGEFHKSSIILDDDVLSGSGKLLSSISIVLPEKVPPNAVFSELKS